MSSLYVLLHDIRSCYNVGSIFRTCDGFGVSQLFLTGHTPFPMQDNDTRLPHVAQRAHKQISKTALGAESIVPFKATPDPLGAITRLQSQGVLVVAIEQTKTAQDIRKLNHPQPMCLVFGSEPEGLPQSVINAVDITYEIPMTGHKESFNVAVSAGIALFQARS